MLVSKTNVYAMIYLVDHNKPISIICIFQMMTSCREYRNQLRYSYTILRESKLDKFNGFDTKIPPSRLKLTIANITPIIANYRLAAVNAHLLNVFIPYSFFALFRP